MDILAARKKAAERARAQASPVEQPAAETVPAEPAGDFPPVPDTSFVPDGPAPAPQQASEAARVAGPPVVQAQRTSATAADAPPAPEPDGGPDREQELEMLSFLLGSEEYVVAVDQVREVLTPREITPVPLAENYLLGVCSLRGAVMPIIDLNLRLGLSASVRDEKSRIIVVSLGQDDQVGLCVDRVRGVVRFDPSIIQPAPETVAQGAGAEFLKGIARKNDRLYILLDVEKAAGAKQTSENLT